LADFYVFQSLFPPPAGFLSANVPWSNNCIYVAFAATHCGILDCVFYAQGGRQKSADHPATAGFPSVTQHLAAKREHYGKYAK
jgi:hypothetical protein